MQNLGGQTECIMGNWKIENRRACLQAAFDPLLRFSDNGTMEMKHDFMTNFPISQLEGLIDCAGITFGMLCHYEHNFHLFSEKKKTRLA